MCLSVCDLQRCTVGCQQPKVTFVGLIHGVVSADLLQKNVEIKKRKYHLRSYERSFVGSEAVQWLVSSGSVEVPAQTETVARVPPPTADATHTVTLGCMHAQTHTRLSMMHCTWATS